MAKYSYELKKKIVEEYLSGEGGFAYLAKKHGVKASSNVDQWVKAYQAFGDEGLMRSRKNKNYTFEFKLSVVELYLTTEMSYQELALKVGMNNPRLVTKWVDAFRIAGPDAIRNKSKGREEKMSTHKEANKTEESTDYLKRLEEENLKLKIENTYLKELRRLRLEKEAQNKKQELSVTSEDYFH